MANKNVYTFGAGKAEGKAEGEAKAKLEIARALLNQGMHIDAVCAVTKLNKEDLRWTLFYLDSKSVEKST